MNTPLLITMGDAAGVGPEIVAAAFRRGEADGCVVVGDPAVLRRAGAGMVAVIDAPADLAEVPPGCLPVLVPPALPEGLAALPWGRVDARAGAAAAACIEEAVRRVRAGEASALVTAPIHKEALAAAGVPFPGHTEMLQALAADGGELPPVRMMLANEELRVVLVTIHVALRQAIELVTPDAVLRTLRIAHAAAAAWGQRAPRIAVAGLNPHAGEGGLFGREEIEIIAPAIEAARAEGVDAQGPFPPDTVFMRARRGAFDLVVAMTHDHGLIPVKYLGVEHGVNVTLGLPFVRTSPDHGTAFDIAGQGRADPASLVAAIRWARAALAARGG
ncbi:4-hydroxythreonine-4-phosphate dehydrogenase PdxA [Rubrivivax sp. JA1029]|uniref:4-hydroxythreonine-4-phosphate dehydrogenase PdxA n=1 Tax=Rubrivivax sp. JA1029 TaxID=2894193 RepID=UPI001E51E2E5|nr:4-hydroxythreonine-4-phosphate dehydrogenase PdxA [Rubrivivax sp. JA1029]MCC9648485.1 4-hydroxythreonine-4-phosphate dehydrogenase PdxA [Rubrivivax sp. JA1029]